MTYLPYWATVPLPYSRTLCAAFFMATADNHIHSSCLRAATLLSANLSTVSSPLTFMHTLLCCLIAIHCCPMLLILLCHMHWSAMHSALLRHLPLSHLTPCCGFCNTAFSYCPSAVFWILRRCAHMHNAVRVRAVHVFNSTSSRLLLPHNLLHFGHRAKHAGCTQRLRTSLPVRRLSGACPLGLGITLTFSSAA